jgi:hypothetical protein
MKSGFGAAHPSNVAQQIAITAAGAVFLDMKI